MVDLWRWSVREVLLHKECHINAVDSIQCDSTTLYGLTQISHYRINYNSRYFKGELMERLISLEIGMNIKLDLEC